jgi:hypothetical protein
MVRQWWLSVGGVRTCDRLVAIRITATEAVCVVNISPGGVKELPGGALQVTLLADAIGFCAPAWQGAELLRPSATAAGRGGGGRCSAWDALNVIRLLVFSMRNVLGADRPLALGAEEALCMIHLILRQGEGLSFYTWLATLLANFPLGNCDRHVSLSSACRM